MPSPIEHFEFDGRTAAIGASPETKPARRVVTTASMSVSEIVGRVTRIIFAYDATDSGEAMLAIVTRWSTGGGFAELVKLGIDAKHLCQIYVD
jgi:hypothetical protein